MRYNNISFCVCERPSLVILICKVHKQELDDCSIFRLILSALQTATYNLDNFLVPILNPPLKRE